MWNSGKKNCALRDKKKYILTLSCCPKKIFGTKQKTITPPPPLQVKWSVPKHNVEYV